MSNRLGFVGALVLAVAAMICGTVLMALGKVEASTAWPSLLVLVVVPTIGVMLGQRLDTAASDVKDVKDRVGDVQTKVNGRMTELINALQSYVATTGQVPNLQHPENRQALGEALDTTQPEPDPLPVAVRTPGSFGSPDLAAADPIPTQDGPQD